jgi:hypothetical protein
MILPFEIQSLDFEIMEPECNSVSLMAVDLYDCFTEQELQNINRRDIGKMKTLARSLLEDRAIIKRQDPEARPPRTHHSIEEADSDDGGQNPEIHSYSLQFTQAGANIED